MISRNRKWEPLENGLHMLESNGWHFIVQMFIVFCSECLKQKTIIRKGYWWWLHFFYHSVSTMISGYMPVYLVTNKQDVPAVFSTTCRVIALDSILNF